MDIPLEHSTRHARLGGKYAQGKEFQRDAVRGIKLLE